MEKHTTKLIDGTFTADQAKNLLFQLLSDKISFHSLKQLSNEERYGKDNEHSQERINELINERIELLKWLSDKNQKTLIISCNIEIEVDQ